MKKNSAGRRKPHVFRYMLIGFFTMAPLWVTWLVFDFLFGLLANTGAPFLRTLARLLRPVSDTVSRWLLDSNVQYGLAAIFTLAGLYVIGLLASLVIGKRFIASAENWLGRVPLVHTICSATKRFLKTVQTPPVQGQRVVLISFPSQEMKAVGLVTRVMMDTNTGQELAAVYVPTSPNPTSGYIEILSLADVVMTDWTMEEAMSFVMTGGTNAPDKVRFGQVASSEKITE